MITIKDIAQKLKLSTATISRTLNNDETLSIAPETRQKILMTADEMGYIKSKRTKSSVSKTKVLIIHKLRTFRNQIDSAYYFSIRTGIEEAAIKYKVNPTFMPIELIEEVNDKFDGVIVIGNHTINDYIKITSEFKNVPITSIGITTYFPDVVDNITYHNYETVNIALSYLFENGHKNIGYIGVKEVDGTERFGSRKGAFIEILKTKKLFNSNWLIEVNHGDDRVEQGYNGMLKWLSSNEVIPTAIFCANDPVSIGVLRALDEKNIQVPDDISIISHDGIYHTKYTQPPITTIDVHTYELGYEGIVNVCSKITNNLKVAKQIVIKPQIIIRESVKKL